MKAGMAAELAGIQLGDQRLNRRSQQILAALAANPEASINAAHEGWSDTQAAYRFFDNPAVTPEKILQPHLEATRQRMRAQPVVLIAQDTTELDYTAHPPGDALCLNTKQRRGLYDHTQLAFTPERLCLGVVGCEFFARAPEDLGKSKERSAWPIEEKESLRWLSGYRSACELAAACPDTQVVSIADCEADIYDIFVAAQETTGTPADFLIRSRVERCLTERDQAAGGAAYRKLRQEVERSPLLGMRTLELCETPKREARVARLEIRALTMQLKPPHERPHLPPVTLQVVLADELDGPDDGTRISWLLLTSLPAATLAEAERVLDYYAARWTIEVFFRVLKSGCRVEEIQLETLARLQNCLMFYKIIAARLMHLTHLQRTTPSVSSAAVVEPSEWKSVWCVVTRKPLPPEPPTLGEFLKLLTKLGGYNDRATESPAGPQPLWVGLRRMLDFSRAWLAFGPDARDNVVCK